MTKEELEKEAREYLAEHSEYSEVFGQTFVAVDTLTAMVEFAVPREKRIAELEEKISNLLSCKNCPENKGGFICQKEYEDKCLAQKIQYIRELKEANEMQALRMKQRDELLAKLKEDVKTWKKASELNSYKAHELGERANQLLKDKGNLIDENNELKKQVEKMKCCYNCKHSRTEYEHCITNKHEKWEIKEND